MTQHPHWGAYILAYFYLGGIAAGAYAFAVILRVAGDPADAPLIRWAHRIAFPLVLLCLLCLILDLGRPERFWHMLIQAERFPLPMFKLWSPMSVGAWALLVFSAFTFVSFLGVQVETGRVGVPWLVRLDRWARARPRPVAALWEGVGTFFGFFVAGYTGVLLSATNQPVWRDTNLLGALFLASAASTALATLYVIGRRTGEAPESTLAKLKRADRWVMGLELVLVAAFVVTLGSAGAVLLTGAWGAVFWLGAVGLGVLAPLAIHLRPQLLGARAAQSGIVAASLVLAGGLALRTAVIYVVR